MRTLRLAIVAVLFALPLSADLSYVYVRAGEDVHVSAGNIDVEDLGRITRRFRGSYLWVDLDGEERILREPETLAEIERAFEPLRALAPQLGALRDRMKPLERQASELEERIDALDDEIDDARDLSEGERERLEATMREVERELRQVERRIRDLEREERRLERLQDEREEEAERELERIIERAVGTRRIER